MAELTDSEKLDELIGRAKAWDEDSKLMKEMAGKVIEWDHLFKGNKDMKVKGVFERMWDTIDKQGKIIENLPCAAVQRQVASIQADIARFNGFKQGVQGCKSKKEKAKEWGPVGFVVAVGIAIWEYIRRGG